MRVFVVLGTLLFASLQRTFAHEEYQSRIPNGANVKDDFGDAWPGVGHERRAGGGDKNVFGVDFKAAGYEWTEELCRKDSDGDGISNGVELGDPDCNWDRFSGEPPQFDSYITHPGFANTNRQAADTCANFTMPDLPTVLNFTFSDYTVPASRTSYIKMAFPAPSEDLLGLKFTPIIDSPSVVHHMLLYACTQGSVDSYLGNPTVGPMPCTNLVMSWAVGGSAFCLPPEVMLALAATDDLLLEIHYDNPTGVSTLSDSSGFMVTGVKAADTAGVVYQEAAFLMVGASFGSINIPPGRTSYELQVTTPIPTGTFGAAGIDVFAYFFHAHQLGRSMWMTLERDAAPEENCPTDCATRLNGNCQLCFSDTGCCGSLSTTRCTTSPAILAALGLAGGEACCSACGVCQECAACYQQDSQCNPEGAFVDSNVAQVACNPRYDFDLQEILPLAEPTKIFNGDTLRVHCIYDSTERSSVTRGGDATEDEMCITFLLYYPADAARGGLSAAEEVAFGLNDPRFYTCKASSQADVSAVQSWMKLHATLNILAWAIVVPLGVLVPLLLRSWAHWFQLHRGLMVTGVLLSLVAAGIAVSNVSQHFWDTHGKFGAVMVAGMLIQPINGLLRPHLPSVDPSLHSAVEKSSARRLWELLHINLGRCLVLGGLVGVSLGLTAIERYATAEEAASHDALRILLVAFGALLVVVAAVKAVQRHNQVHYARPDDTLKLTTGP